MASLQGILAFSMTARHLSFAQAARELGLTPSTVAKSVARLEHQLGLRLFHRTTRKVALTPDGRTLFERCARILEDIDALQSAADDARHLASGVLRLSVPTTYGRKVLMPALIRLLQRHPALSLDVRFSDQRVDLVGHGLDAAIRIGALDDSTLVARRIDSQQLIACASPKYLRTRGTPGKPDELAGHHCLVFRIPTSGRERPWQFKVRGRMMEFTPTPRLVMDEGEALVRAAAAQVGIIQVPDYMAEEALHDGKLVEILQSHRPPPLAISLVYPSHQHIPSRLRALAEHLATTISPAAAG